jgi:hypothetical protein
MKTKPNFEPPSNIICAHSCYLQAVQKYCVLLFMHVQVMSNAPRHIFLLLAIYTLGLVMHILSL